MGVIANFADSVRLGYSHLSVNLPPKLFLITQLFLIAILIVIVAFIIWGFYSTLSKKDFIVLNLRKYNTSEHPVLRKLLAVLLYFIEYILIMPALILVWYIVLSIILLLLVPDRAMGQLLLLTGSLVMAIRILSYIKEEISKELAKLFPFIAVSIYLLNPDIFTKFDFFDKLNEIPVLFENIVFFLVSISVLEIILRISYTAHELAMGKEEVGGKDKD